MTTLSATRNPWQRVSQWSLGGYARLRRKIATFLVVLLFGLSLSEPILCVIHCQIWLPIAFRTYYAALHGHNHAHYQPDAQLASSSMPLCSTFVPADSHGPFDMPPSPVHDLAPTRLIIGIMLLLLTIALPAAPPIAPPQLAPPRLLRPPKLSVA